MKKRLVLSLSIVTLLAISVKSQSVLAEFELPPEKISNIQSYVVGDTILLSIDTTDPKIQISGKRFYMIGPAGGYKKFSTVRIGDSLLCGVSRYENDLYLYYLSGKRKNLTLKAIRYNSAENDLKLVEKKIELGGTLVGSWNDNGLFLTVYDKSSNQLKILQVNGMELQSNKVFKLPFDFSKAYKKLSYIHESRFTSIAQGSSKFKIYKIKNELILTVDLTLTELETKSQTTVVRINIETGEQIVKRFTDNTLTYFRSFISNDKIYQASVSKDYFLLRVHDLTTGDLIEKRDIVRDTTFKESFVYRRIGSDFRISRKETLYSMMKISPTCLPAIVISEEDSSRSTIIWGTYFNDKGVGTPAGIASNPLAGLITMVVGTAIKQMAEAPGVSRYFYLQSNGKNFYEAGTDVQIPLRQVVDDYEISLDLKRIFSDYKGYFDYQGGGVGVYRGHRDAKNKLTLIKFDRKESGNAN